LPAIPEQGSKSPLGGALFCRACQRGTVRAVCKEISDKKCIFSGDHGASIRFWISGGLELFSAQLTISDLTGVADWRSTSRLEAMRIPGNGSFVILGGTPLTGLQDFRLFADLADPVLDGGASFGRSPALQTRRIEPVPPSVSLFEGMVLLLSAGAALGMMRRPKAV
jgi:hypothetical protein